MTRPTKIQRRDEHDPERFLRWFVRHRLASWSRHALPRGQRPVAHHLKLIEALGAVCHGRCDRLMVLMPPGSAKSTYASVLFPAWYLARNPGHQVVAASHTASLAHEFGGRVRSLVAEFGRQLGYRLGDTRARHDFKATNGGSYFAVGVRGAVTGRRADLILIDDPVKSTEDAESALRRDQIWNWYRADLLTRLKPGGRIVLIMTRWHEDDLGGRLLAGEPGWTLLRLPALAETADPLGRAPGEALWPDWEDTQQLNRKRAVMGERAFAALFQQQPRPPGPGLFRTECIRTTTSTELTQSVRAWDLAATEKRGADYTVGLKLARDMTGRFIVQDIIRLQAGSLDVVDAIRTAAATDGRSTLISLPQDPGQAGKHQTQYLTSLLAGYRVHSSPETGSKLTRAMPVASQIEAGTLSLHHAPWNQTFLTELADFPSGRNDDQVDALSRAFAELTAGGKPTRQVATSLGVR